MEDLKFVKARSVATRSRYFRSPTNARSAAAVKDENADMLRETLSCSLKLPSMDSGGDIDDDGRPLTKS